MLKSTKALLLAGASALAILACAAEANAETFSVPGMFSFTPMVSGEYSIEALGASGGDAFDGVGGLGAQVSGDVFLNKGEDLTLVVGGQGLYAISGGAGGGGGGGSFIFQGSAVIAAGGGGGGAGVQMAGGQGLTGSGGGAGGGAGGVGGVNGAGGNAGAYGGGGGAGVNSAGGGGFLGGSHWMGGRMGSDGGGGYGGGGAGANGGGGGGGGFSGGGGGGYVIGGGAGSGGGGGSYLASLVTNPFLTAGVNSGDGSISIDLLKAAVPEPSTWAMALAGFAGLGWLAHMRRRKFGRA